MIKHKCPICKRVWYCVGDDCCKKERRRLGSPLGGCMCSECILVPPDDKCEVVYYVHDWRIA